MATGMVAAPPCAVCGLASARIELALTTRSAGARTTLERICQATGRPERGGLNVRRPYEQMDWPMQEAMQQPSPHVNAWQEAMAQVEAAITLARTDRDTARQLLALLTIGCGTCDRFDAASGRASLLPLAVLVLRHA